jgi:type IV secretion system protein VirD4
VADASRIKAQKPVLSLIQWCMFQELKRHQNKHRPVYLIADEATNFKIHDLGSLLTWGRGYGLRLHLVIQSFSAFRQVYGSDTLKTLLSETEIKQFLAGQREPETLKMIEEILGEQSIISKNHSGKNDSGGFGMDGFSYQENGKPLMTADEVRRTDKSILIIRKNKPMLTDLPPIAAIAPWRTQIDINPFHGKPFLKPIKLRLKRHKKSIVSKVHSIFRKSQAEGK